MIIKFFKKLLAGIVPLDSGENIRRVEHLGDWIAVVVDRAYSTDVYLYDENNEEVPIIFETVEDAQRYAELVKAPFYG